MKSLNIKFAFIAVIAATALVWGVKNYSNSIVKKQQQCIPSVVVDDLSAELLRCYETIDTCNKYFRSCLEAYMEVKPPGEEVP